MLAQVVNLKPSPTRSAQIVVIVSNSLPLSAAQS